MQRFLGMRIKLRQVNFAYSAVFYDLNRCYTVFAVLQQYNELLKQCLQLLSAIISVIYNFAIIFFAVLIYVINLRNVMCKRSSIFKLLRVLLNAIEEKCRRY